ncbi:MAG: hypothetical protein WBY53_12935 [Acidobacteriaceae bacterium]
MDYAQALSMFQVGAITGAKAIEKPTEEGSIWVVELIFRTPLPPHISGWLEVARGGKKVFKSIQAALNDIKNIGVASATVQFGAADSFRRNRFEYLYEWIRFCHQQGYDEEGILKAFETNPATSLQPGDEKGIKLAKVIIQHALGKSDGKELESYLPPIEVLDVKYLKLTDEGHLCQATHPDGDFVFLISLDVSLADVKSALSNHKVAMCKFTLVAAHYRNPQGYTDPETPGRSPAAAFRLTRDDLHCLSANDFKDVRTLKVV